MFAQAFLILFSATADVPAQPRSEAKTELSPEMRGDILMARKIDKPYILNGCLFGAAVGAGFAAFESAGYAFNAFLGMLPDKSHESFIQPHPHASNAVGSQSHGRRQG